MTGYYAEKLSAERLKRCYDIAPPRIQHYLDAEIDFVLKHISSDDKIMELGCGYGRVLKKLFEKTDHVYGIDNSHENLIMASNKSTNAMLVEMDAAKLAFIDNPFDVVLCIQNGISAFKVDRKRLLTEAIRVTQPGGAVLFSSYSEKIWPDRLKWFELQAEHGLLGEIDYNATGNGVIVCKDGFRAETITPEEFKSLADDLNLKFTIKEIDDSSLFLVINI